MTINIYLKNQNYKSEYGYVLFFMNFQEKNESKTKVSISFKILNSFQDSYKKSFLK